MYTSNWTDDDNCTTKLKRDDWKLIGISGAVSSCLSILGCIFIIAIMIIYKKYVFATQRLIIYLTISILLNTIGQLLQRISYDKIYEQHTYCSVLGFLSQYFSTCILLSITCILIEMLMRVVFLREGGRLEWLYISAIFLLPATISWIPFINDAFGAVHCFCSIKTIKHCEKYTHGIVLQALLWWVPLYSTIMFGIVSYLLILCQLSRQRKKYTAMIDVDRDIIYHRTLEDVGYFRWYPILYVIVDLIPIASSIHDFFVPNNPIVSLWIATSIIKGLQGGLFAIAVALDPNTRKRLTCKSLRSAFIHNILMKESTEEYPITSGDLSDSLNTYGNKK